MRTILKENNFRARIPDLTAARVPSARGRRRLLRSVELAACLGLLCGSLHAQAVIPPGDWRNLTTKRGLSNDYVNAVAATEQYVYVGTRQGLNRMQKPIRNNTAIHTVPGLPHPNVLCLLAEGAAVWIGTERGLGFLREDAPDQVTAGFPPGNLRIQALALAESSLWVATNNGLYQFDPQAKTAQTVPGLGNQNWTGIEPLDAGLALTRQDGSVWLLNPRNLKLQEIRVELNPLNNRVTSISHGGDYVWFGTSGSGLIGYDTLRRSWLAMSQSGKVDEFITQVTADGRYLWLASFSGLLRFDQAEKKWLSLPGDLFSANALTSICTDGEMLWVGTAGSGVIYGDKQFPHLEVNLRRRYFENEQGVIQGRADGPGNLQVEVFYRSADELDPWHSRWTTLTTEGAVFRAQIDFRQLADGMYLFKIVARDAAEYENEEVFTLVKDTRPKELEFNYHTFRAGQALVQGEYRPENVEKIVVFPGGLPAKLDTFNQTFSADVVLQPQDRRIQFLAYDADGRKKRFIYPIQVLPQPKLAIATTQASFLPGYDDIRFTVTQENLGELEHWEFQITDPAGNSIYAYSEPGPLPDLLTWNGRNSAGEPVAGGKLYYYNLQIREKNGFELTTPKKVIRGDLVPEKPYQGQVYKVSQPFLFDPGEADIKPYFYSLFDEIRDQFEKIPGSIILIEGHTDNRPVLTDKFANNQELSEARAKSVAEYLERELRIAPDRISIVGYGTSRPVASNDSWVTRAQNRRVDVMLLGK